MIGVVTKPGCVVASRVTGSEMKPRKLEGSIVQMPELWPLSLVGMSELDRVDQC